MGSIRYISVCQVLCLCAITSLVISGCGSISGSGVNTPGEWVNSTDVIEPGASSPTEGAFGKTVALEIVENEKNIIEGWINSPDEVVTYEIGELSAGDVLKVEVIAGLDGFDPAVAVFDSNEDYMHLNDDRSYYARRTNPYVYFVVRKDTDKGMVAVSASPRSDTSGPYQLQITLTPGTPVEAPDRQIAYLDFEGHDNVTIGSRAPVDVPRFSGSMIDARFAPYTDELIEMVVERVRENYANFDVTILSSNEQDTPSEAHTTIYLGSYNPALLGIADSIDSFNKQKVQDAIIFVDTFSAFMSQDPTLEEMAIALANVTSHELGHLLGLQHTKDTTSIMDTTASLRQMLLPQSFNRSVLNPYDAFKVGYQNAPMLLLQNVGGDEAAVLAELANSRFRVKAHDSWYDEGPKGPAREHLHFGTACTCH